MRRRADLTEALRSRHRHPDRRRPCSPTGIGGVKIVSACRRIGVSASGEVRLLFGTAIMTGGLDGVEDALPTPTPRYADTFPLRTVTKNSRNFAAEALHCRGSVENGNFRAID